MILSIHQPSYFPWLGLLDKIMKSDVYMVMDDVQLSDSNYQHRNIFLTNDGKIKYLTIPFNKKSYSKRRFRDLEITDQMWNKHHLDFLKNNYQKHPFYEEIMPALRPFFEKDYHFLIDAVFESMNLCFSFFEIKTKIIFQSEMDYNCTLHRGDLVFELVKLAKADCYLSGKGATVYLDEHLFTGGISLKYSDFVHPHYVQKSKTAFTSGLSSLDLLFNVGIDEGRKILGKHND